MIVEWLISLGATVSNWFASLFPVWDVPEFLVDFDATLNDVLGNLSGVGAWVDWLYILLIVTAVMAVWGIALLIKVARAVAAHVPFVGGAG